VEGTEVTEATALQRETEQRSHYRTKTTDRIRMRSGDGTALATYPINGLAWRNNPIT